MAFFFLMEPSKIADQSLVYVLGEAMQMVDCAVRTFVILLFELLTAHQASRFILQDTLGRNSVSRSYPRVYRRVRPHRSVHERRDFARLLGHDHAGPPTLAVRPLGLHVYIQGRWHVWAQGQDLGRQNEPWRSLEE
jgi:hypothetical protein